MGVALRHPRIQNACRSLATGWKAVKAPDHSKANWLGISSIIEMISTAVTSRGYQVPQAHYFLRCLLNKLEALQRQILQC